MFCVNHPKSETLVRCNKCLDPICPRCAVPTRVGLRCKRCARGGSNPMHELAPRDVAVVLLVALPLGLLAGGIGTQFGFFLAFFVSAPIGAALAEAVLRATRAVSGARSKSGPVVQAITCTCIVLGAIAGPWLFRALLTGGLANLPRNPLAYLASAVNLNVIIYAVLAAGAALARLR